MSAPLRNPAPIGTADELREFAAENLQLARIQADLGATYAEIGDDPGLEYATRKLVAHTRAVVATVADLKALKQAKEVA